VERASLDPDRFARLFDAAVNVSEKGELRGLLETIVDTAMKLTNARYGALGVIGSSGFLVEFIHQGVDPHRAGSIGHPPLGLGVLGTVIRGETVRTDDLEERPDSTGFPEHHPKMDSFLGVPVRTGSDVFGNLYLANKDGGFTEEDEEMISSLALIGGCAVANARIHARLREVAVAEDRARIARDIHDDIIQDLFAVGLSLQGLAQGIESSEVREAVLSQVSRVDDCISSLRRFIFDLRSTPGVARDLEMEVTDLVEELAEPYDAEVDLTIDGVFDALDENHADTVLNIVKEATSNALRHSGSDEIRILVSGGLTSLVILVQDQGKGFDPDADHGGMGLTNLRRRTEDVGGELTIASNPGEGTALRVVIPIG
jgi:signal transduction histidine kinase